jgi:hypothetical protein
MKGLTLLPNDSLVAAALHLSHEEHPSPIIKRIGAQ